MCEVMENFVKEAKIETAIEIYLDMSRSKEEVITALMNKFSLSESDALKAYEQYAPVLK